MAHFINRTLQLANGKRVPVPDTLLDNRMKCFIAGTIGFFKTDGGISEKSIQEAWFGIWTEYLASKCQS